MNKKKEKTTQQKKEKSILETIREVNEKERKNKIYAESERVKTESAIKDKENEEYSRQLQREKIELMKMKQGLAEGTSEAVVQPEYTFFQKLGAFFYCNKGMVILISFFIFLAVFLVVDLIRKPRPDFTLMVLTDDSEMEYCCDTFEEIISEYIEDTNGNGEILASAYYMPISEEVDAYTLQSSSTKLFALMQDGETIMLIANDTVKDYIIPDETLENLEELYPDNENVRGYGFYLSGTKFAEDIGYEGEIPEDVYIGLRKVKNASYREKMQKNYDAAKALLDVLVERYSD